MGFLIFQARHAFQKSAVTEDCFHENTWQQHQSPKHHIMIFPELISTTQITNKKITPTPTTYVHILGGARVKGALEFEE